MVDARITNVDGQPPVFEGHLRRRTGGVGYPRQPNFSVGSLYDDENQLLDLLRSAIQEIGRTRAFSLQRAMAGFDWQRMAPRYDDILQTVLAARK